MLTDFDIADVDVCGDRPPPRPSARRSRHNGAAPNAGAMLAKRLGIQSLGRDGHNIKAACIACESSDAFRVHTQSGIAYCHRCHLSMSHLELATARLGDEGAAWQLLEELGLEEPRHSQNGHASGKQIDPIEAIARAKHVSADALRAYGAAVVDRKVVLPAYGPDGARCTTFALTTGKGIFAKGHPAGLFFPHIDGTVRLPRAGETWQLVEGPKDAAALYDLGLLACGMNTCRLAPKFARLFGGVAAVLIPDRDKAGIEGAPKSAGALAGHAASIRIAHLPAEIKDKDGDDVRDILRRDGGRELVLRAIADAAEWTLTGTPDAQPVAYDRITCAELAAGAYDLEYLIDGVLVARQPCIFAGSKKTLKTSLLIALGLSLATGEPYLGHFAVGRAARVLLMTGESGLATIQETALRIAAAQGIDLADVGGMIVSPHLPLFGSTPHMDALRRMLTDDEIEVLIVDPAYLAMPTDGSEASLFAMGALLRSMTTVCQEIGVTFVLAHHTRKNLADPYAMPELEDIAWAGFNEFARQWLLVGRRERYEPGSGEHRLWLNIGGSAGHSSCWAMDIAEGIYRADTPRGWALSLTTAQEARGNAEKRRESDRDEKRNATSTARIESDRKAIVAVMVKMPDGTGTKTDIRDRTSINPPRFRVAWASLVEDWTVRETEIKKGNNRTYAAWKLRDDNSE